MDIQSLRLYLGLCRNLHFARTSDEFHTSASALSRTIQRLEETVSHQLLLRDNRSVALTAQGEIFRQFAEDTISRWEAMQVELGLSEAQLAGKLTLFASVTASMSILPNVLARFRQEYPHIQIQLETGYAVNAMQRLKEGCDVVVAALPESEDEQLIKRIIMDIPIVTVAPLPAAIPALSGVLSKQRISWETVPLILPSSGQTRNNIDVWLRRQRIKPNIYSEVAGNEATLALVALGCGVGFVPRLVLEESPLFDKVRILENGPALSDFHVGFCTRKRNLDASPLIRAFWESIAA